MRTTLTLDPDVADRLALQVKHRGLTFKAAVNDALRRGLGLVREANRAEEPYVVKVFPMGLRPGIDPTKLGQLADELEAEEVARKLRR